MAEQVHDAVTVVVVELGDINFGKLHEVRTGEFSAVTRRNEPGQWQLDMHLDECPPDKLMQVNTVVVRDERRVLFAGYRKAGDGGQGGTMRQIDKSGRRVSIEGIDCWFWLKSRLVFPDPATDEPWGTVADVRSGVGATVAAAYINANAGSTALLDRRIPGLTVATSPVGKTGEWSGRLQPLSDLITRIATEAEIVVEPTLTWDLAPVVNIRDETNRTNEMVVTDLADLADVEQRDVPAASTWVLAAGQGSGVARVFRSAGGGAGVNRIETLTEQSNATTTTELFQIAEATRRQDGFAFYVSGNTSEQAAEQYRYLVDYQLGDLVSVQVSGIRFPVPITAVNLSVTSQRTKQTPVLGTFTPDRLRGMRKDILNLSERFNTNIA